MSANLLRFCVDSHRCYMTAQGVTLPPTEISRALAAAAAGRSSVRAPAAAAPSEAGSLQGIPAALPLARGHVPLPPRRARPATHRTDPQHEFSDLGKSTEQGRGEPQNLPMEAIATAALPRGRANSSFPPPSGPHAARGSPSRGSRPATQRLGKSYSRMCQLPPFALACRNFTAK